ncbi:MAG: preprotein translocase subunit SecA [Ruminococcaceae bacterium]|nr:preprotein translocase subunit SecA [Oscillospiraceae bacterium]
MGLLEKLFGNYSKKEIKRITPLQEKVLSLEEEYKKLTDAELKAKTAEFKERLSAMETLDDILPEAFATCREASARVLGMRHFPVQILGGIVLHQGRISEMKTGEGKTLVATLPAYLNALSGKGVHIVTVNDYLAKRDSEWMGKLYGFLGLTVGLIIHGMNHDEKKAAYDADITYCTNNELGFDYLRDNMAIYSEHRVQREHNFAIVDEVDSILIDEARTPLIISGKGEESTSLYTAANRFAKGLKMVKVTETDDKKSDEDTKYDGDYVVDEKAKTATLTPQGVKKAEAEFKLDNLTDAENMTIAHHINQAIKAHGIMKRDVDYVVKDGEIIIVDEFTGRLMFGRRYNEGLHQAIEAKEGVKVASESKTLATITFQNFFRLYSKLSGMTGTALTEEAEFRKIYNLDVVEIPTNKPVIREDNDDIVYKTELAKFTAVINQIKECYAKGQPVLVGTVTIEKSEILSAMLKKENIPHNVLNAKHHEKEAEIVAQAGKLGAVTIATNMAGRGTDIMLGGNAEFLARKELKAEGYSDEIIAEATGYADTDDTDILTAREKFADYMAKFKAQIAPEAEKVKQAGGLFIIGTERHESRRIDNQLRGRAGRQGDPGNTRFYVSFEDDLMRLFAGDKLSHFLTVFKVDENMPFQTGVLSSTIESAQGRVEARNFGIRERVLEYDDVMNQQRALIYKQRNQVLDGEDIKQKIRGMVAKTLTEEIEKHIDASATPDEWNFAFLRENFAWLLKQGDLEYTVDDLNNLEYEDIEKLFTTRAEEFLDAKEERYGEEKMREIERTVLLRTVDEHWMVHIDAMDELRQGVGLRSYGQHNPVIEYRNDGTDMFNEMIESIRRETAIKILVNEYKTAEEIKREKVAEETGSSDDGSVNRTVRGKGVVSKNALCPCGSGKKYKRCCGKDID